MTGRDETTASSGRAGESVPRSAPAAAHDPVFLTRAQREGRAPILEFDVDKDRGVVTGVRDVSSAVVGLDDVAGVDPPPTGGVRDVEPLSEGRVLEGGLEHLSDGPHVADVVEEEDLGVVLGGSDESETGHGDAPGSSVVDAPKVRRGVDTDAAPFSLPDWSEFLQPEPLLELSDQVKVLPSEVAAVAQVPNYPDGTAVYLKGSGGRAYLHVDLPMAEVCQLLEDARTGGTSPPF